MRRSLSLASINDGRVRSSSCRATLSYSPIYSSYNPTIRMTAANSCILTRHKTNTNALHYTSGQGHKRTQEPTSVDDRTQYEIYAHPFMMGVMAGVACVMCSYHQCFFFVSLLLFVSCSSLSPGHLPIVVLFLLSMLSAPI